MKELTILKFPCQSELDFSHGHVNFSIYLNKILIFISRFEIHNMSIIFINAATFDSMRWPLTK